MSEPTILSLLEELLETNKVLFEYDKHFSVRRRIAELEKEIAARKK